VAQEVCGKGVVVDGVEDAQRFAILFIVMSLLHVLLSPAKVGGPFLGTIRCYTSDILLCMAGFVQADSDGRGGGYVDIIDMGVKLGVLEHDFDESVVNVGVRNGRVEDAGPRRAGRGLRKMVSFLSRDIEMRPPAICGMLMVTMIPGARVGMAQSLADIDVSLMGQAHT
jgi:hypothetical protein